MKSLRKLFAHLRCPDCDASLTSQKGDIGSGCLTAIGMEMLVWLSVGLGTLILDKCIDDTSVFILTAFILCFLALIIGRNITTYICKSCKVEYNFDNTKGIGWIFIPNKWPWL